MKTLMTTLLLAGTALMAAQTGTTPAPAAGSSFHHGSGEGEEASSPQSEDRCAGEHGNPRCSVRAAAGAAKEVSFSNPKTTLGTELDWVRPLPGLLLPGQMDQVPVVLVAHEFQ